MPINVDWYNDDHTIVVFDFIGRWTWEEYAATFERKLVASVSHRVDVIFDFTNSAPLPPNAMSKFGSQDRETPPNAGDTVVVTRQRFIEALVNVFNRIYRSLNREHLIWIAHSREEAVQLLQKLAEKRAVLVTRN